MKLLSAEVDLGSATNISKSPIVRIYNSDSSALVLTRKNNVETTLGSYTIPPGKVIYCQKAHTDTLEGGAALKATGIGYSEMLDIISVGGGAAYSDGEIYSTNLLYHLDANNSSSYESGDGNTWTDLVAGTTNATIYGATHTEGTGDQGFYFDFDGTNDYVNIPQAAYTLGSGWSIEVWARNDNASVQAYGASSGNSVFSSQDGSFGQDEIIHIAQDRTELDAGAFGAYQPVYSPVPSTQAWHQYVLTQTYVSGSNATIKVYIDKTEVSSTNNTDWYISANPSGSALGRRSSNPTYSSYWDGQISIFRTYSEPLTTTQIETNYDAHKGRYGLS